MEILSRNGKVEIVGAIFPVPSKIASDMFEHRKNIFAKFTKMNKLKPGHKILFYASHGIKGIIGEAQVEGVEFLTPSETLEKYAEKLFLNPKKFKEYIHKRWTAKGLPKMLVISLTKLKRYDKPVQPKDMVTVSGRYLIKSEWNYIKNQT